MVGRLAGTAPWAEAAPELRVSEQQSRLGGSSIDAHRAAGDFSEAAA
jgi:hypothetical protein